MKNANVKYCECDTDGYCRRFERIMHGRLRILCKTRDDYRSLFGQALANRRQHKKRVISSFYSSMKNWLRHGMPMVVGDMLSDRRDACERCQPNNRIVCKSCLCFLPLKQRMATESCPIGNWQTTIPELRGRGCGCGK